MNIETDFTNTISQLGNESHFTFLKHHLKQGFTSTNMKICAQVDNNFLCRCSENGKSTAFSYIVFSKETYFQGYRHGSYQMVMQKYELYQEVLQYLQHRMKYDLVFVKSEARQGIHRDDNSENIILKEPT